MIQLLRKLVLIKKISRTQQLEKRLEKSGFELPDQMKKDDKQSVEKGKIIQVGQELPKWKKLVGQKVIFNSWAGDECEVDGEKFLIIHVDDILAIYS